MNSSHSLTLSLNWLTETLFWFQIRNFFKLKNEEKESLANIPGPTPQRGWSRVGAENSSKLYRKGLLKVESDIEQRDARVRWRQSHHILTSNVIRSILIWLQAPTYRILTNGLQKKVFQNFDLQSRQLFLSLRKLASLFYKHWSLLLEFQEGPF
jgi:hypothetical protein